MFRISALGLGIRHLGRGRGGPRSREGFKGASGVAFRHVMFGLGFRV